jgi:predicted Zn-ribbon and HTH transcriptional regulator
MDEKFRKEFKDIVETKEFKEIETQVKLLNDQLKAMHHYHSYSHGNERPSHVEKTWLYLEFGQVTTSVSREDPLLSDIQKTPPPDNAAPSIFHCTCNKCGAKWDSTLERWVSNNCPKCNSSSITIEEEKGES